jgi:hypothetical protein
MADERNGRPIEDAPKRSGFAQVLLPRSIGVKVGMLLAFTIMVIGGFVGYVLYARGVFEDTQRLRLIAENAEGIGIGTDLTFSGFPIGRVRRITLQEDGKVRISVRVPVSEAKWLRTSSIFVIDVPLVGAGDPAHGGDAANRPGEHRADDFRRRQLAGEPRQPAHR